MKKILITPLLTMLLVGCQLVIVTPSSSLSTSAKPSSSSDSNSTSSSTNNYSSTIITSSSSNTGTSSNPTSSSGTSTSSGSSSEEPINTRKVPFNQIGSLVAQVVDAKAMGIVNSKDRTQLNGRRNAQGEDQNYMVKVTETYNPNTQITEDETVQVTFSRVTNTQTTELQNGTESYVASAEPITIERITDLPGNVVITNVPDYEFRALNGDIVLQDWTSSDQPTIEFLFERLESGTFNKVASANALDIIPITNNPGNIVIANNPEYEFRLMDGEVEVIPWQSYSTTNIEFIFNSEITNPTIEYRGINALITFESNSNLTYDISFDGQTIIEGLVDNGPTDLDSDLGTISINGLTQGFTYEVAYTGEIPNQDLTNITIESRSLNASISFIAFEGFNYTIKQGETIIYEGIEDNDEPDTNEAVGNITLFGLTEGLTYDVTYAGYRVIETITQDEVEGQVDKLYVLYQYTFISFVPLNLNNRPQDQDLELDYDDVPLYDKQGYFSDSTRQSFVVDNDTGLIYKIENINIASLSGGCVAVQDSPFPYDITVTELGNLEFFSLYQNPTISTRKCFKDIYGNKFIENDTVNLINQESKTVFYVFSDNSKNQAKNFTYELTEFGEAIRVEFKTFAPSDTWVKSLNKMDVNLSANSLTNNDNFKIFNLEDPGKPSIDFKITPFKIENGYLYGVFKRHNYQIEFGFFMFNSTNGAHFTYRGIDRWGNSQGLYFNMDYLIDYDILVTKSEDGTLIGTYDVMNLLYNYQMEHQNPFPGPGNPWWINTYDNGSYAFTYTYSINLGQLFPEESFIIMQDAQIYENKLVKFDLEGNIDYDLVPQFFSDKWILTPFITGTYIAPPITSVTLQPINR